MKKAFSDGHFYSPVADVELLRERKDNIWNASPKFTNGIDYRASAQKYFIENNLSDAARDFDYPDFEDASGRYHLNNGLFGGHDALVLSAMLRHYQPKKIFEIGSGYSSLLISSEISKAVTKGGVAAEFVCVDPYPRSFIDEMHQHKYLRLLETGVELLPVSFFSDLQENDILFIDSSHVSKTGSDVNYLFFEVLPSLSPGVLIHIHDVFLPFDYPIAWVLDSGISWNEQYILQAFMMYSKDFEVLFGSAFCEYAYPNQLEIAWGRKVCHGSSFWIRRI